MRNLNRITNFYNRLAAWDDWKRTVKAALAAGVSQRDVERLHPPEDAGWRTIDRATAKLNALIEEMNVTYTLTEKGWEYLRQQDREGKHGKGSE